MDSRYGNRVSKEANCLDKNEKIWHYALTRFLSFLLDILRSNHIAVESRIQDIDDRLVKVIYFLNLRPNIDLISADHGQSADKDQYCRERDFSSYQHAGLRTRIRFPSPQPSPRVKNVLKHS